MANKGNGQQQPQTMTMTSVAAILSGFGDIDERKFDFVGKLDGVDGEEHRGVLPTELRKLHAAYMQVSQESAELEQKLRRLKRLSATLRETFSAGVEEVYPGQVKVEQNAVGISIKVNQAVYFGPGWNVYSAPTSSVGQASARFEAEHKGRAARERAVAGLSGIFGGDDDDDGVELSEDLRVALASALTGGGVRMRGGPLRG